MAPISQREARRLLRRVAALERQIKDQRSRWSQSYFGGVNIATLDLDTKTDAAIRTARALNHAVVVVGDDTNRVRFMALPHPSESI